jgi:hypothetical protein
LNAGKTMYSPPYSPGSPTGPCSGMPPIPVAIGTPTPAPVPASGGTYSQVVTVTNGSNSVEGMLIYCATSGVSYTSTCAGVEFSHDLPGSFQYFVYAGVGTICPSGPTQQFTGNEATVANPPATSVVLNVT